MARLIRRWLIGVKVDVGIYDLLSDQPDANAPVISVPGRADPFQPCVARALVRALHNPVGFLGRVCAVLIGVLVCRCHRISPLFGGRVIPADVMDEEQAERGWVSASTMANTGARIAREWSGQAIDPQPLGVSGGLLTNDRYGWNALSVPPGEAG